MAVTLTSGERQADGTFGDVQALTQSTATARQSISIHVPVTTLSGGTATGFGVDLYTVASGAVEGFRKEIYMLATGEAKVVVQGIATIGLHAFPVVLTTDSAWASATSTATTYVENVTYASATGAFVLSVPGHYLSMRYVNTRWWVRAGFATFATAT